MIGAALTTLIFNEKTAIIGLLVLSISDSLAAIVGIKFGAKWKNILDGISKSISSWKTYITYGSTTD